MTHVDPLWMREFLVVHVAAGFTSFILAPVALATAKGGKQHKRWGIVYFWAMAMVAGTALPMSLWRPVFFLSMVSVFSFYLVFSGSRVLKLKDMARSGSAGAIDWMAAGLAFVVCTGLVLVGLFRRPVFGALWPVAIVLGLVGMRAAGQDLYTFWKKPREKMFWWYSHLSKFIASYIAAWTAFSTVTLPHVFPNAGLVLWLWPVTVGVPAVVLTVGYYKRKFASRVPVAAV